VATALVVPSIREAQVVEFLTAWHKELASQSIKVYLVEDSAEPSFQLNIPSDIDFRHLTWRDAPKGMLDCITVKSPGCRQIGFWAAYQDGCDPIITLDDDVRPHASAGLFAKFKDILLNGIPVWVDPLINYRSRGYPIENIGRTDTVFHVGCFLGIPDVDGETQLAHAEDFVTNLPAYIPRPTILPAGQLIPVNGGICGWRRALTPYIHYTIWYPELKYRRFDDIWMGIILKRLLDLSGLNMSYGPPYAEHIRASEASQNAEYEKAGKVWNESFWQEFDEAIMASTDIDAISLDANFKLLAEVLQSMDNRWAKAEGAAMIKWRQFF